MSFKIEQAQAFYHLLTGEPNPVMVWQVFCDYEKRIDLATWWQGELDGQRLKFHQDRGCGVFATINGGGRYSDEITQFRAVFMDSDGIGYPDHWVVPPHIIVERDPTHYHAYWLLDGDCNATEWSIAQKQIALHYGSDESIINQDRVMRVPGFVHQKDLNNPQLYELKYMNPQLPRYKLRDIAGYFTLTEEKSAVLAKWINQRNGQFLNEMEDYDDCQANQLQYINYLKERAQHGIDGQGRNHIRFKTAAAGRDYGLSPETTVALMLEHWDHGNTPPCGEELIQVSVHNAYRYHQNKLGSRGFGLFLASEAAPLRGMSAEPVEAAIYVPDSLPKPSAREQAQAVVAQLTNAATPGGNALEPDLASAFYAKNHTQNAVTFLSAKSPNGEVMLHEGVIYVHDGKVFKAKDPKYLHHILASDMQFTTPSVSDINGSVDMIKYYLLGETPQKWPEWKLDPERDTSGLIAFNNGVLDMRTNEWFEHTPLLRIRSCLPYDYDYTATCPNWEKFMWDTWGDSPYEPLIEQLQMWFGYLLTDDTSQQKMAIISGNPRSGKGTIMRIITRMLGDENCAAPSLDNLAKDVHLYDMSHKMAAVMNDVSDPSPSIRNTVVRNIKSIVGEDDISVDRKYLNSVKVRIRARLNMTCNALPNITESSSAMLDRGLFFYTPRSHSGNEDIGLTDRLYLEMPGIINWAMDGLRKLQAVGKLRNHPCMDERIKVFKAVTSPLDSFMNEELILRKDAYVTLADVFKRYRSWAIDNDGGGIRSAGAFSRQIDAMSNVEMGFDGSTPILRGAFLRPLDVEPEVGGL